LAESAILDELKYIHQLIIESLGHLEEISRPRAGNVFWRLFFPAGQFSQSKSAARAAAAVLTLIDSRLNEMAITLQKNQHPFASSIYDLMNLKLGEMAEKLIEIPEREQYIQPQIENVKKRLEGYIKDFQQ